jgi:hypothetical protein
MRSFEEVQKSLKPTENLLREHPETDPRAWMNLIKKEMDLVRMRKVVLNMSYSTGIG